VSRTPTPRVYRLPRPSDKAELDAPNVAQCAIAGRDEQCLEAAVAVDLNAADDNLESDPRLDLDARDASAARIIQAIGALRHDALKLQCLHLSEEVAADTAHLLHEA
jgi:hypothetical protein